MLLDRVSNPGPLTYQSGALPIARLHTLRNEVINMVEAIDPAAGRLLLLLLCCCFTSTVNI